MGRELNGRRFRQIAWFALLPLAFGGPAHGESRCTVPHELIEDDGELPVTTATLVHHKPLKIVAIGGASTAGSGASGEAAAYPMRLQEHL